MFSLCPYGKQKGHPLYRVNKFWKQNSSPAHTCSVLSARKQPLTEQNSIRKHAAGFATKGMSDILFTSENDTISTAPR